MFQCRVNEVLGRVRSSGQQSQEQRGPLRAIGIAEQGLQSGPRKIAIDRKGADD